MSAHESVLLQESIEGLSLANGDTVVDATVGLGGHTEALCRAVGKEGRVLGIEADSVSLQTAQERLSRAGCSAELVLGNFRDIDHHLAKRGITEVNGMLFDLGWNASQLDSGRGFSFRKDEPLVMTLKAPEEGLFTAKDIVETWSEADLTEIIRTLGEERFADRIAKAIVAERVLTPIETSLQLARVIEEAVPAFYRRGRTHPATKTFQALRITVNDELSNLRDVLGKSLPLLAKGGRIAVITFHSLEDGLVKRIFKSWENQGFAKLCVKKPITPSADEVRNNPRARSAKLRIVEKL